MGPPDRSRAGDRAAPAPDADVRSLAAVVAALEPPGPILVVADHETIGRCGPLWWRVFAAAGRRHRVRLCGGGTDPRDVAELATEAVSLGAVVIVAAGAAVVEAARRAAAQAGLPSVVAPEPLPGMPGDEPAN